MVSSLPTFTVIVAVRNGATTLQRALDSVFTQTHDGIEIVVMDGASADGTQAILERNTERIAYWESEPDRGVYHAWNKALEHATGDWVCFLGADDWYDAPDVFARMAPLLGQVADRYRIVFGSILVVRPDGSIDHEFRQTWDSAKRRVTRGRMPIPHPATFHRRILFDEHGRFDESFRISGDYEFLLRELVDHEALSVPIVVVDMAAGGISDRPATRSLMEREMYRARYMNGLVATPPWRSGRLFRRLSRIWLDQHLGRRATKALRDGYRAVTRRPRRRS